MSHQQRTILIIDDSPEDRELYRRYLLRDQDYNYTILEAQLGREGLELWQRHQPDAVLLDYRLPDLDGLELLAQIPSQTQQPRLPVIMVTGQGNEAIAVQAMKAGAQDYLIKGQITLQGLQLAVNSTIETVQLRTQLQQRIERERLVGQITRQIHQSLEIDEILQTTVTEVRQFLQCDRVVIFRLQSEAWGTVTTESVGTNWTSLLSARLHDPCLNEDYIESFRQGLVTVKPDIHDGSIDPCHVELLAQLQVKANLVVPILQKDQLWGMLIAHHCAAPRQWQTLEIDLLKELTTQVGIALQQAELYQQAQNELAERKRTEEALRESQAMFEAFMRYTPATAYLKDETGRYLYVTPLNEQICQRDMADWVGKTDFELFPDKEAQQYWHNDLAAFAANQAIELMETHEQLDGEHCYLSYKFPIQLSPERRLVGSLSLDITDRQRAEEALRENEQLLRLALSGAHAGSWDWEIHTGKIVWSPENYILYGLDPANGLPQYQNWENALHPDDRERANAEVHRVVEQHLPEFHCEFRIIHPQFGVRWLLGLGQATFNEQGEPLRLSGINLDITERKQAEEALQKSEEFQQRLLASSTDCIKVLDLDGRLMYMNTGGMCLMEIDDLTGASQFCK